MPTIPGGNIQEIPALPKGEYPGFRFDSFEENAEKQYYALCFKSENEIEGHKRTMFRNLSYKNPNGFIYIKRTMLALGVEPEVLDTDFDMDECFNDCLGNEVTLVIGVQGKEAGEYEGRNDVKSIKGPRYAMESDDDDI